MRRYATLKEVIKLDNEKVIEIVNRIEADFRELQKVTGEEHISAFIISGNFHLISFADENGQTKLDFFRPEA